MWPKKNLLYLRDKLLGSVGNGLTGSAVLRARKSFNKNERDQVLFNMRDWAPSQILLFTKTAGRLTWLRSLLSKVFLLAPEYVKNYFNKPTAYPFRAPAFARKEIEENGPSKPH